MGHKHHNIYKWRLFVVQLDYFTFSQKKAFSSLVSVVVKCNFFLIFMSFFTFCLIFSYSFGCCFENQFYFICLINDEQQTQKMGKNDEQKKTLKEKEKQTRFSFGSTDIVKTLSLDWNKTPSVAFCIKIHSMQA